MKKYKVITKVSEHIPGKQIPVIKDDSGNDVCSYISLFLSQNRDKDQVNQRIQAVQAYNPDYLHEEYIEPIDLIDDNMIRGIEGKPGMLEFYNDNFSDPPIDIISKKDLIEILNQWKDLLEE